MGGTAAIRVTGLMALMIAVVGLCRPAAGQPPGFEEIVEQGRPLIQLTSSGNWRLEIYGPLGCIPCVVARSFVADQVIIFPDGRFVRITAENDLLEPDHSSEAVVVSGSGSPEALAELRSALRGARIGFQRGGCHVPLFLPQPGPPEEVFLVIEAGYQVTWHGRGNRIASFRLGRGAGEQCPESLITAVQKVLFYPDG